MVRDDYDAWQKCVRTMDSGYNTQYLNASSIRPNGRLCGIGLLKKSMLKRTVCVFIFLAQIGRTALNISAQRSQSISKGRSLCNVNREHGATMIFPAGSHCLYVFEIARSFRGRGERSGCSLIDPSAFRGFSEIKSEDIRS